MTKVQLDQAQSLLTIFESANLILDSTVVSDDLSRDTGLILGDATHAFVCLTGRMPSDVSRIDLNTQSPAQGGERMSGDCGSRILKIGFHRRHLDTKEAAIEAARNLSATWRDPWVLTQEVASGIVVTEDTVEQIMVSV